MGRLHPKITKLLDYRFGLLRLAGRWLIKTDRGLYFRGPKSSVMRYCEANSGIHISGFSNVRVWYPARLCTLPTQRGSRISVISAFPSGQLGNRIYELAIGLRVAASLGSDFTMVWRPGAPNEDVFGRILQSIPVHAITKDNKFSIRAPGSIGARSKQVALQADFISAPASAFPERDNFLAASLTILRDMIPLNSQDCWIPGESVTTPVMHVRGTDRLMVPEPPGTRPPPLAYYVRAALNEGCSRVKIVSDEPSGVLVKRLVSMLLAEGIHAELGGVSLEADLQTMASAEVLMLCGSSLSGAVAGLSTRVKKIYQFEGHPAVRQQLPVFTVFDSSRAWDRAYNALGENFPAAVRALMQDVTVEGLGIRKSE